ncbi:FG-GAP repeat protein [Variovorax sp. M-6]|uniref:FG-GAP repeat protein n=1 Tax=Variovorax sp. M-6 TaxID=3233041 RepID=UPI003F9D74E8
MVALALAACGGGGDSRIDLLPVVQATSFTIGGNVSGLAGTLVLRNNGRDDLTLKSDGPFRFADPVTAGNPYAVAIAQEPEGQTCAVSAGQGTATTTVTDVRVACSAAVHTVGGTLSGLTGGTLVLRNNGTNALSLTADGNFAFAQALPEGAMYDVTVGTQPAGQLCTLTGASGMVNTAVTSIAARCATDPSSVPPPIPAAPTVGYAAKAFLFSWPAIANATYYRLGEDPGASGSFTVLADNLGSTTYALQDLALNQPPAAWRYALQACNANGCSPWSLPATADGNRAIGYFKPAATGTRNFGLGISLSPDGSVMAVGASNTVELFTRSAGQWQWAQTLSFQAGSLPRPVISDDGTLLVGIYGHDGAFNDQGQVQLFSRTPSGWTQADVWDPPVPRALGNFGAFLGVSRDGTVAVVGEYVSARGGSFHVYRKTGVTWAREATIEPDHPQPGALFGVQAKISADGGTIVVGAQYEGSGSPTDETDTSAANAGAAFVYGYDTGAGAWTKRAYLKAPAPATGDLLGASTAISADGDTVVIGARNQSVAGVYRAGTAYVFRRNAGTYTLAQTIQSPQLMPEAYFGGFGLALTPDGTALAIAALGDSSGGTGVGADATQGAAAFAGAVHLHQLAGGQFVHSNYLKASNTGSGDGFGDALEISADGRTVAVGASREGSAASGIGGDQADNSIPGRGAVYLY